nr:MAG TPA: hypothetical protein [Caudoviricetes sp.]
MAKTLEQIQAELEALKTQFTDFSAVSPVSYYTHQYSGEEIDQAVGTLVRPNLLDNWYFGRPVDQRGGYVVPPGVEYKDVNTGITVGTTTTYYPVTQWSNGNAIITVDGLNRFVQPGGFVRGYVGQGYTFDRWKTENNIVVTLERDGVSLENVGNIAGQYNQELPPDFSSEGTLLCISVIVKSVSGDARLFLSQSMVPYGHPIDFIPLQTGLYSGSGNLMNGNHKFAIYLGAGAKIKLAAAKLELGPTQTLAHQENGQWVLNEVPDYGEQLRRCQRYFVRLRQYAQARASQIERDYIDFALPVPVPMRSLPVIHGGTFHVMYITGGVSNGFSFSVAAQSDNNLRVRAKKTGHNLQDATLEVANYLDLSADL